MAVLTQPGDDSRSDQAGTSDNDDLHDGLLSGRGLRRLMAEAHERSWFSAGFPPLSSSPLCTFAIKTRQQGREVTWLKKIFPGEAEADRSGFSMVLKLSETKTSSPLFRGPWGRLYQSI
jgi:hypothetical protein